MAAVPVSKPVNGARDSCFSAFLPALSSPRPWMTAGGEFCEVCEQRSPREAGRGQEGLGAACLFWPMMSGWRQETLEEGRVVRKSTGPSQEGPAEMTVDAAVVKGVRQSRLENDSFLRPRIPASPGRGRVDHVARQAAPTLGLLSCVKSCFPLTGCVTWVRDGITAA